jgi:hypothetical protein
LIGASVLGAPRSYFLDDGVKRRRCEATAISCGNWLNRYSVGQRPPEYSTGYVYPV